MPVIANVGNDTTVPDAPVGALPGTPGVPGGGGVSDLPGWRKVPVGAVKVPSPVVAPPNAPLDVGNADDRPGVLNADTGALAAFKPDGCATLKLDWGGCKVLVCASPVVLAAHAVTNIAAIAISKSAASLLHLRCVATLSPNSRFIVR